MKKITICIILLISSLLFAQQSGGNLVVKESKSSNKSHNYKVGDHELFIMPTGKTMPKGSACFSDYELFFLNYTFAPTDRTQLGIFTLFPVITDFLRTFTVSAKHNYYNKNHFSLAVLGSLTPDGHIATIGNVCSFTNNESSFHLALSRGFELNKYNSGETIYMAGVKLGHFIAEYTNSKSLIDDINFDGFITAGFRIGGKKLAFDIAGVRALHQDLGLFIAFPLVKVMYKFK